MLRTRQRARVITAAALLSMASVGLVMGAMLAATIGMVGPLVALGMMVTLLAMPTLFRQPWLAVVLAVLVLPVGAVRVPGTPMRVTAATVGIGLAVVMASPILGRVPPVVWKQPMIWPVVLIGIAVVSATQAVDGRVAIVEVALLASGVATMVLVPSAVRDAQQWRAVVWVLLGITTLISGLAVLDMGPLQARAGAAVVSGRATGVFTSPNQLGTMAAIGLLLSLGCWAGSTAVRERAGAFAALGVCGLALAVSLSRGAWIGAAAGVVALAVLLPAGNRRLLQMSGLLIVGLAGVLALQPSGDTLDVVVARFDTLLEGQAHPYDNRLNIYAEAVEQIVDRPLLGQGPGSFPAASRRAATEIPAVSAPHAHNVLLTVAAELGIPAALVVIVFTLSAGRFVWALKSRSTSSDRRDAALLAGVAAALVTLTGQGLVDYTFRNPILFSSVWLLVGLLLASPGDRRAG